MAFRVEGAISGAGFSEPIHGWQGHLTVTAGSGQLQVQDDAGNWNNEGTVVAAGTVKAWRLFQSANVRVSGTDVTYSLVAGGG